MKLLLWPLEGFLPQMLRDGLEGWRQATGRGGHGCAKQRRWLCAAIRTRHETDSGLCVYLREIFSLHFDMVWRVCLRWGVLRHYWRQWINTGESTQHLHCGTLSCGTTREAQTLLPRQAMGKELSEQQGRTKLIAHHHNLFTKKKKINKTNKTPQNLLCKVNWEPWIQRWCAPWRSVPGRLFIANNNLFSPEETKSRDWESSQCKKSELYTSGWPALISQ